MVTPKTKLTSFNFFDKKKFTQVSYMFYFQLARLTFFTHNLYFTPIITNDNWLNPLTNHHTQKHNRFPPLTLARTNWPHVLVACVPTFGAIVD